ncbi:MAG: glycogen/starch/alpha-glucan phosphorylase [Candidatus Acidiferrales bacterium]
MTTRVAPPIEPTRSKVRDFANRTLHELRYSIGKQREHASTDDLFRAVALAARCALVDGMMATDERYDRRNPKRVYYISIEFLIGRLLRSTLSNLGVLEVAREAARHLEFDLEEIMEVEPDAALGNGGLGRLAACFLETMATLGMPAVGFGINYEYGMFQQDIENGAQRERADHWLRRGTPWQLPRRDQGCLVPAYGRIVEDVDRYGHYNPMWMDWQIILGIPHDVPIAGYGGRTVNALRLYSARASEEFNTTIFNQGDYIRAIEQKITSENISKVLYPSDNVATGRELRLLQEYFLVSCALREILRRYQRHNSAFDAFPDKVAIQLNDTHPAIAIAELMRLLVDHQSLPWEKAWRITQASFGYTNHTLLPEALEKWPVSMMQNVLPRHLQIIYEINRRFLEEIAAHYPGDGDRMRRMSIIEEQPDRRVRMAHLSIVGSHSVNGVAALHTELVKRTLVPDFYDLWPERFNNKTNGVTHRRWLLECNPDFARLVSGAIGDGWITELDKMRALEPYASDAAFQESFLRIKRANKDRLARFIRERSGIKVNPDAMFDVHAKRIHEYKRQLLNVMHVIHLYRSITDDGRSLAVPRVVLFAGKAAPGYFMAKIVIRLINHVAAVVNNDPRVGEQLRVVFLPDYRVTLAERIIPAADLSEQISTAGMEASGTGNMKFAMNGALTMGTLDGANIEILEEGGAENIYIFGLTADQVEQHRRSGSYNPRALYESRPAIRRVMDSIRSGLFDQGEPALFQSIVDAILHHGDRYFHLADLEAYITAQGRAAQDFTQHSDWARRAILNVARMGKFSSDRTIREYARDIWRVEPVVD